MEHLGIFYKYTEMNVKRFSLSISINCNKTAAIVLFINRKKIKMIDNQLSTKWFKLRFISKLHWIMTVIRLKDMLSIYRLRL